MAVEIRPVVGRLARHRFVALPFKLYADDPDWIPPLRLSVLDRISPKHPANATQETALWMAYRGHEPVGRIGACIDRSFNELHDEKWCWVGFFECVDDAEVAGALFDAATRWGAERGMSTCVGPASFTLNDECGLLVENFDDPPLLLTTENPRYYEQLWTGHGWEKAMDLWAWSFPRGTHVPERHERVIERLEKRANVTIRTGNMKDFDNEVDRIFSVYNAAWSKNWGFSPVSEAEVRHLAKQVKRIVDPNLILFADTPEGETVGCAIMFPDANEPMKRVRSGRLLPFGWARILIEMRKPKRVRVWALGIKPEYESRALGPLLYTRMLQNIHAIPSIVMGEASWVLETNDRMNKPLEAIGGTHYKTWRMYQRAI